MLKSRLNVKYNFLRSPFDPFYERHQLTTFFNKPLKKGKSILAFRIIKNSIKQCKLCVPLSLYWLFPWLLKTASCPVIFGRTRKGKNYYTLPLPVRRNKKIIVVLNDLFKYFAGVPSTPRFLSLATELLGTLFFQPEASLINTRRKKLYLAYQLRTEAELRRW